MYSKMTTSIILKAALALALVGGFASTASAQVGVTCQYFTGQFDPLSIQSAVTDSFWVPATAVQTNSQLTKIIKASGIAEAELNEVGAIDGGFLVAEVDAKFKQLNNDPSTTCPNSATVRGAGELVVAGETLALRFNSQMSGKPRVGTIAVGPVGENEINSIHRVNASLRFTAQGTRNNDSLRFDRGTVNTKGVYEAVEGSPPGTDEDVLLICTCLPEIGNN
jgi:hypothetical protein